MSRVRGWAPWIVLLIVLGVGLGIGATPSGPPPTVDQQVRAIAAEVRCPSCADLNSAQSNDVTAVAVRAAIRQRLVRGQSRAEIEAFLVSRYGPDILLRPPSRGVGGLVWLLPVIAATLALLVAVWALRRWRAPAGGDPSAARIPDAGDEALVRRALDEVR
ncbi:MAG TPA: cytochrome c-type biogenesis protein CcmH [Acidimicrobiales bacterium]|nr:cytochrome c-type biogenesis protein CcmH [Acidimicrobiales bacterium]